MIAWSNISLIMRSQENNMVSSTKAMIETRISENAIIIILGDIKKDYN